MIDSPQKMVFKKTIQYLRRYTPLSVGVIALSFFASVFESFSIVSIIPILQTMMSDGGTTSSLLPGFSVVQGYLAQSGIQTTLLQLLLVVFVVIVVKNILVYVTAITINKISNFLRRDLQNDLFSAVVGASAQFFDTLKIGHLVGSISVYSENIAGYIFSFLNLFVQFIRLGVYLVLLCIISLKMTVAALLLLLFFIPITQLILRNIQKIGFYTARTVSELHSHMVEMFGNIRLMKLFATEEYERRRFSQTVEDLKNHSVRVAVFSNLFTPSAEIFLALILVLVVSANIFYFHISLTERLPFVVVYLYLFMQAFSQLIGFNTLRGKLSQHYESFVAYEQLLADAKKNTFLQTEYAPVRFMNEICFDHVSFSYIPGQQIIRDVTLRIPKGASIAFVGPTGSGKTTLVNLLSGLYRPQLGTISVDGQALSQFSSSEWLATIGFVSQENILFNDTIRNNITYGLIGVSDDEVMSAARAIQLHEYIMELPEKYDTRIGERGVRFSGGQKQRLSIARAIIRQPEILILDEATSSLDSETETIVKENLKKLTQGKTVIAIAHRLSTIQNADVIFVIDKGGVVEQGSHMELLSRKGFYSHFYYLQFHQSDM